jgi:transglutaminase-like putative cysteine protease
MRVLADPPSLPFRREKTLAVGVLAFLAPIPLAFTNALEVGALVLYLAAGGFLLAYTAKGRVLTLSNAALNAVGVAYAGLLWVDLRYGSRTLLKTALHLLLFTTIVKLASIKKERDFSVALALSGFLFLASVATSFHYSIGVFLLVYLLVGWPVLVRWSLWRDLAAAPDEWRRDRDVRRLPGLAPTFVSVAAAMVLAAPLFFLLPRLKTPFVRGVEQGREITTGFSESVDPETYGTLKRSERVYLRIATTEPIAPGSAESLRMRALAFTRYEKRGWGKPERGGTLLPGSPGTFQPLYRSARSDLRGRSVMTIDLSPLMSRYVPYPSHGTSVRFGEATLRAHSFFYPELDDVRNLRLPFEPERTLQYEATYGGAPIKDLVAPGRTDPAWRPLGSERVAAFTRSLLAGVDPIAAPERAARRIESALQTRFSYSLEIPQSGEKPVEEFLFVHKAGHCEAFSTAMALMLREVGIPSRFVTGFVGGEIGLFGRYVIVRGANAHAWVEAWCGPTLGWVTFDPTPAAGRPTIESVPLARRFRQLADGVEFFYDRYILGFGQGDQVELVRRVREVAAAGAEWARGMAASLRAAAARAAVSTRAAVAVGAAAAGAVALLLLFRSVTRRKNPRWRTRGLPPASFAYRKLQKTLKRSGAALGEASAPGETLAAAATFGPHVARLAREIVRAYVAESFGAEPLGDADALLLVARVREAREAIAQYRKAA